MGLVHSESGGPSHGGKGWHGLVKPSNPYILPTKVLFLVFVFPAGLLRSSGFIKACEDGILRRVSGDSSWGQMLGTPLLLVNGGHASVPGCPDLNNQQKLYIYYNVV